MRLPPVTLAAWLFGLLLQAAGVVAPGDNATAILETLFGTRPFEIARRNIQPPSNLLLPPETALVIITRGSIAGQSFTLRARVLQPGGLVQRHEQLIQDPGTRVATNTFLPLNEGYLLSVFLSAPAIATQRGELYVLVLQGLGPAPNSTPVRTLFSDYLTTAGRLGWPEGRQLSSVEEAGAYRVIDGTNPAAGNPVVETVPTGARWRLHSIEVTLTTAGAAGNRVPTLSFRNAAASEFATLVSPQVVPVGTTARLTWSTVGYSATQVTASGIISTIGQMQPALLRAGNTIRIGSFDVFDPLDDFSDPVYLVEEWME